MVKTFRDLEDLTEISVGGGYTTFIGLDLERVLDDGEAQSMILNVEKPVAIELGNAILAAAGPQSEGEVFASIGKRIAEAANLADELGFPSTAQMLDTLIIAGMADAGFLAVLRKLVLG